MHYDDFRWSLWNLGCAIWHVIDCASGHWLCGTGLFTRLEAWLTSNEMDEQKRVDERLKKH